MILPIDESGASAGFGDPDAQVTGDSECFTVVFRGNLRKLAGNPHRYVTPFGKVLSIGMGNAFETDAPTSELHTQAGIDQAVAVERERCARIAEGSARRFDFQKALAEQDDLEYGRNGARLDIARAIREGSAAPAPQEHVMGEEALQVCRERRYAWALSDAELAKDARELLEELDGFNGLEYDSDSEVACQRSHSIISALLERFSPMLCGDEGCPQNGKPHVCNPSAPSQAMRFFSDNVDKWGALEWFDRLAKAIREQDKAVLAKDETGFDIYRMIAASSAMTLVREHEATVRAALATTPAPASREAGGE